MTVSVPVITNASPIVSLATCWEEPDVVSDTHCGTAVERREGGHGVQQARDAGLGRTRARRHGESAFNRLPYTTGLEKIQVNLDCDFDFDSRGVALLINK